MTSIHTPDRCPVRLRPERPSDHAAIAGVVARAFREVPFSDQSEPAIVRGLREAGALTLSLVAEADGAVIGHAAFSPVAPADGSPGWFGLGPVAVDPPRQRRGVGAALIDHGLGELRRRGAAGCVVLGEPAYYRRFGFRHHPQCVFEGAPAPYFQVLAFAGSVPRGRVVYHRAFGGPH